LAAILAVSVIHAMKREQSRILAVSAILAVSVARVIWGINYFADLRMTFRQNFFLQDWFRNKFGVGLG
jgi:hypothetical protein